MPTVLPCAPPPALVRTPTGRTRWTTLAWVLIAASAAPCSDATAREVHRCVDARGAIAFQDRPCTQKGTTGELLVLPDHPADAPALARRAAELRARASAESDLRIQERWNRESQSRLPVSLGGSPPRAQPTARQVSPARYDAGEDRGPGTRACERARRTREQAYRERGNSMNFDTRRRLQDELHDACGP